MTTKMKNKILLAGALTLSLGFVSCADSFLDTSSKTESNTDTFYKTETDAYRALIGCYDGWRQTNSNPGISFYVASEVLSAECLGATGNTDGRGYQVIDRFDQSQSPADLNLFENDWKRYYEGVYRCNELISRQEQIEWKETDSKRGEYLGQAYAIRALLYFDMVRLWGNIPLLTEPTSENVPQSDAKDVFELIVSDLKYAAANIPASSGAFDGHITKYAAEALLARVYLFYSGYYGSEPTGLTKAEALAAVEDVISSGNYALVPEFKNLWRPSSGVVTDKSADIATADDFIKLTGTYAGDDNPEVVLSMKFTSTQDYDGNNDGNRWLVMMGVRTLNSTNCPFGYGWGCCTVVPSFYASYLSGDTRRDASIINLATDGYDTTEQAADQREQTGYTVKKYTPMCYSDGTCSNNSLEHKQGFQEGQYQDYVIMRYADVLLMAAELGSSNALNYFNMVRDRAFGDSSHRVTNLTQNVIMQERKWEFAFESINYWDLLRQGIDYAASQLALNLDVVSGGAPDNVAITAENVRTKKGLCQIPYNQITLSNNVLKQNAGW